MSAILSSLTQKFNAASNKLNTLENLFLEKTIAGADDLTLGLIENQIDSAQNLTNTAQLELDTYLTSSTVPSATEQQTINKYQNSSVIGGGGAGATEPSVSFSQNQSALLLRQRTVPGVPAGAQQTTRPPTKEIYTNIDGKSSGKDLRVKIRVPNSYLDSKFTEKLSPFGGILFPYTPTIGYESKAEYSQQPVTHSNYVIKFYQRSSVGNIQITGKFSVENESDAEFYLSTLHLLRALTKMRFGGSSGDTDSGAPPPVCRLDGHGQMMLENVPVVISNVRIELPDSVDYFISTPLPGVNVAESIFGPYSVPTLSTISVTCEPMYSRNEMLGASVTDYLNNTVGNRGYL